MIVDPAAATLRALVDREYRRRLIVYDPNVRLHVEASRDRWREVLQWMIPRTPLLKVSEEDLGLLYPGVALPTLAARWIAEGVVLATIPAKPKPSSIALLKQLMAAAPPAGQQQ